MKIRRATSFRKDFKREKRRDARIRQPLVEVTDCLARGEALPGKFRDHLLIGNWKGHRECHIKPDLLLIYKITDEVVLVRLGSHGKLF